MVTAASHGHRAGHGVSSNGPAVLMPVASVTCVDIGDASVDWGFGLVTKLVTCVGLVTAASLVTCPRLVPKLTLTTL